MSHVILGNSEHQCGSGTKELCRSTQLFITFDNILYILDTGNLRIQKHNISDQTVSTVIGNGSIFRPLRIYVNEMNGIYVLDRPTKTRSFIKVWYNNNYNKDITILIDAR